MTKRLIIMILGLVLVFGGVFGWKLFRDRMMARYFAHHVPPPVTISAAKSTLRTWTPALASVGSLTAVQGVDIASEVGGIVQEFHFESGQQVRAGKLLVKLDDSAEQADFKIYQAELKLAQLNYARRQALYERKDISAESLDESLTALQKAKGMIAKTRAIIDHKRIRAPFDGKLGIRKFNLGEYVSPGTPLVSLQSVDPIYVNFPLPEQDVERIFVGQKVSITVEAYKNEVFQGKITAINSKVDEQTRNILVQATFSNPAQRLYPGMFANVRVALPVRDKIVSVPQTAIAYSLYGDSVFVVLEDGKDEKGKPVLRVKRRFVSVGERGGDEVAVSKGLKAGELVVISGQFKLQSGYRVMVDNSVDLSKPATLAKE